MHSHDRTLLQRLGFDDPDKKNPYHDIACQYLAMAGVREKIGPMFGARERKELFKECPTGIQAPHNCGDKKHKDFYWERIPDEQTSTRFGGAEFEVVLGKGEGKYKTHIGFLDVVLRFYASLAFGENLYEIDRSADPWVPNESRSRDVAYTGPWYPDPKLWKIGPVAETGRRCVSSPAFTVVAEVKIYPVGVSDILRQIRLYQEYGPPAGWLVATYFDMVVEDVAQLEGAGIRHVRLGDGFEKYIAERGERKDVPAPSPVL